MCLLGREATQAVSNFLNLNVQTFNTLLLVFQPELERASVNRDRPTNPTEYVSAVGRRMLPALRLYSKWLLVSHEKIHNTLDDTALAVQTKQLWQTYANTLSLLVATFNVDTLPRLDYMLEEDEDIIGFLPLAGAFKGDERLKADSAPGLLLKHDKNLPYRVHPNEEQLSRVLLLLEDGLTLCANPSVPIAVVDGTIIYQEEGMNSSILPSTSPAGLDSLSRPVGTDQVFTDMPPEMLPVPPQVERPVSLMVGLGGGSVVGSVAPSESASVMVAMNRMVDSIVGPRGGAVSEEDEEMLMEDKERGRKLGKRTKQHDKENPMEEEEILFVGRKGRLGGAGSKGTTPTKQRGEIGMGMGIGRGDSGDMSSGSMRATPSMGQRFPTGPRKKDNQQAAGSNTSGFTKSTTASTFETQIPLAPAQQQRHSSSTPPQLLPSITTTTPVATNTNTNSSTPRAAASPVASPSAAAAGTYTASDLVKQLHSYSSQMNIGITPSSARDSIDVTPSRSPQLQHDHRHPHAHSQGVSPIANGGGVGRGADLWWSPGGGQPPNGVGSGGIYKEGETSLFMYGTVGAGSAWSQGQSQAANGGGKGSPVGYR